MDTTYVTFAYGVHVGSSLEEADRIDALGTLTDQCPEVHYVAGGSCTGDSIFLAAYSQSIDGGEYGGAAGITTERRAGWDVQLAHAIRVLGYSGLEAPDWLCITSLT
ncbi:hypothetical protein [Streptomyces hokutonensis]|uniref:hypothetical protein n=1 Tax=Streptomyces hokutonensis TaxID=1306990 RepID=UPI000375A21B|nr:hypothetical protein [Streptomyces hokutonensis]